MKNLSTKLAVVDNLGEHISDQDNTLMTDVKGIINAVISVLSVACVVVMIVGGVQYMTSAGDTGKVEKGKKTIIYGLIGLIISALAFAIVNFLVSDIISSDSGAKQCTKDQVWDPETKECKAKTN